MSPPIGQLRGVREIDRALRSGAAPGLVLVQEGAEEPGLEALITLAREKGVPIREVTAAVIRRMTSVGPPAQVLALAGRDPDADFEAVLGLGGSIWLLMGVAYPTNAGVAIRTAEGTGSDAIVIDAPDFDHVGRRTATRASMRSDWYMPIFWQDAVQTLQSARRAGYRIFALENSGDVAPWDADLTGPVLFVVGGETNGLPAEIMRESDAVLRIPMGGFIPSFNLQIALGVVGVERLRQLAS